MYKLNTYLLRNFLKIIHYHTSIIIPFCTKCIYNCEWNVCTNWEINACTNWIYIESFSNDYVIKYFSYHICLHVCNFTQTIFIIYKRIYVKTEKQMKERTAFIMKVFSNGYTPLCFKCHTRIAKISRWTLLRPKTRNVF